jgi:hypothetical protein
MVQPMPFQNTVSGVTVPPTAGELAPAARQAAGPVQDTEYSALNVSGSGVGSRVQVAPFHRAVSVLSLSPVPAGHARQERPGDGGGLDAGRPALRRVHGGRAGHRRTHRMRGGQPGQYRGCASCC